MKTRTFLLASVTAMSLPAAVSLADFDISPGVSNGTIITNAYTDAGASADNNYTPFVTNVRVFDFSFDDPTPPLFTQDPGFHPQPGSGFNTASSVRVGAATGLSFYNGTGPISFSPVGTNDVTLTLDYAGKNLIVGATAPSGTLTLGAANAAGEFDRHLGSTLQAADGAMPPDGLYLTSLQVNDPGLGLVTSAPAYVLFSVNADDATVDAAKEFLRDNYAPGTNLAPVPEPASIAILSLTAMTTLSRRRR